MSRFVLCDALEPALAASQLSHQAVALGQGEHVDFTCRDTKDSVVLPLKLIVLPETIALGFQQAGCPQLGSCTLCASQASCAPSQQGFSWLQSHSFKLFIKQSTSRRPYLVLPSAKTVLKGKAKKNLEKVR